MTCCACNGSCCHVGPCTFCWQHKPKKANEVRWRFCPYCGSPQGQTVVWHRADVTTASYDG